MGNLKVVANYKYDTPVEMRNVFYFHGTEAEWENRQAIVDEMRSIYQNFSGDIVNNCQLYSCTVYDLNEPEAPGAEVTFTSGVLTFTNSGEMLPQQVALLLSFKSQTSKPNRARKYIGGFGEGNLVDGVWYSTLITHANSFCADLLDIGSALSLDVNFATLGYQTGDPPSLVMQTLTDYKVSSIPATQRRRRPGVGS